MKDIKVILKNRGIRWAAAMLLVAAAFAAGALWRGGSDDGHRHEAEDARRSDAPAAEPRMYTCSMHPQVRSPDPDDKCPICAMDLIPVPEDDDEDVEEGDLPRLRLSPRAAALMEIRTWPVERQAVGIEVDLFGKVGYDERRIHDVVSRTEAYVERLAVNTPWQPVARGETLAEFYSPEVGTAFRELLVARDGAAEVPEAARARLLRRGVSSAQIDAVLARGESPRLFRVESPVEGVALPMVVREGEWLREGGLLVRIADVSRVWINLEAYERDLPWLETGQTVQFSVAAHPGERFEGDIAFIDPVLRERSRTARVRVEMDNPDGRLKPGMLVSARVHAAYHPDAAAHPHPHASTPTDSRSPLVIPASAPLITGRRAVVYVRVPDQDRPTFEPRDVVLGPRAGDVYIVHDGLSEGDRVVVNGQFKIDSELQIRGRPSMMAPEGDAPQVHDHDHEAGEERLQTECPVMGGAINTDFYVDVQGFRLYVCCPGCDQAILDDPETYLEKMKEEGVTPYRLQTHCPVMDGEINREFYRDHNGHRIYVCCPGCLDEVRERTDEIIEEQRLRGVVFEKSPKKGE